MITREDLEAAIAECQGVRNPNANTCIKLAAYLTIQQSLFGTAPYSAVQAASYENVQDNSPIAVQPSTAFSEAVNGKSPSDVMPIIEELMQALEILSPKLYSATIRKLTEI